MVFISITFPNRMEMFELIFLTLDDSKEHNLTDMDFKPLTKEIVPVSGYEIIGDSKDSFILVKREEIGENLNFEFPVYLYKNSQISEPVSFIQLLQDISLHEYNESDQDDSDEAEEENDQNNED